MRPGAMFVHCPRAEDAISRSPKRPHRQVVICGLMSFKRREFDIDITIAERIESTISPVAFPLTS
jgi:hypothetical protein